MAKRLLSSVLVVFAVLFLSSCGQAARNAGTESEKESKEKKTSEQTQSTLATIPSNELKTEAPTAPVIMEAGTTKDNAPDGSTQGRMNLDYKPGFHIAGAEYKPLTLTPRAPQYTLNGDLSNIENMDQFPNLTERQRELIAQNGFVVQPTDSEQLFFIYEDNTYKKVPGFVTTDSVLQLYHIFYDYSLRNLEADFFYEDLAVLNEGMIEQLMREYSYAWNEQVKASTLKMIGYFGVSQLALGKSLPPGYPADLEPAVRQEYELIKAAAGRSRSPLFEEELDYSLFRVRGHYTRSEELGKYFQAMSWYGIVPIAFFDKEDARDPQSALSAIVTTIALSRLPADRGGKLWENIYSTTCFYVGEADDITPYELAGIVSTVYSDTPDINTLPDRLDAFYAETDQLRRARINHKVPEENAALQMRFMGQRYIPDSEILQNLSEPYQRPFPLGLDVFAVFGSERAEELIHTIYNPGAQWNRYQEEFNLLADRFRNQTIAEQTNNLYNGWLYCLKSLTTRATEGYPLFMKNKAWEDKALATALGSWAEIRHDTILYGKQSAVECGGGDEPPQLTGYVEPNPEFFNRLLWLTTATRENLSARGMLNDSMRYKLADFEDMLLFLRNCAQKELNGEDLSTEEQMTLLTYGGTLEYLSSSIAETDNWWLIESDTDKHMAVIADVHTAGSSYLEVGVGSAAEIYVAISQHGKIYLTRGAVFDYYEFVSDQRLTDEDWQSQLKTAPPERPPFTSSYQDEASSGEVPVPESPYSSGC